MLTGTGCSFQRDENVLKLVIGVVMPLRECTKPKHCTLEMGKVYVV